MVCVFEKIFMAWGAVLLERDKMKKAVVIAGICIVLVIGILSWDSGEDELNIFKGIPSAEIPKKCLEYRNDVCGLFDCMVDMCWCDEGQVPGPILVEGAGVIESEEEAIIAVKQYVEEASSDYRNVRRAVKLNSVFFNVFAYNAEGDEKTFTVAADGTIFLTVCGV